MTVGQIQNDVLHKMREYSNSGEVASGTAIDDYKLSMIPLINLYQKQLVVETKKLKRVYEIAHNMPDNQLGEFVENEVHITTDTDNDITYEATGSRAYSFQVAGTATVYIEEQISGVWTTLVTVSHTPTAGEGYVTYKGLTGIGDTTNSLRIRFSGSYRYLYRWVALFEDLFASADDVPKYEPYVPYDMPSNFYEKDRVEWTFENQQYDGYGSYKFEDAESKRLYIKWDDKGEFKVFYYAYPTFIPENGAIGDYDSTEIDLPDEVTPTLINYIASDLKRDEDAYMSDTLFNIANIDNANLQVNSNYEQGQQGIINNDNW